MCFLSAGEKRDVIYADGRIFETGVVVVAEGFIPLALVIGFLTTSFTRLTYQITNSPRFFAQRPF